MCWFSDVLMSWCVVLMCWWLCWCVGVLMCWCGVECWCVDARVLVWCVDDCVDVLMWWCVDGLKSWCADNYVDVLICWLLIVDVLMLRYVMMMSWTDLMYLSTHNGDWEVVLCEFSRQKVITTFEISTGPKLSTFGSELNWLFNKRVIIEYTTSKKTIIVWIKSMSSIESESAFQSTKSRTKHWFLLFGTKTKLKTQWKSCTL